MRERTFGVSPPRTAHTPDGRARAGHSLGIGATLGATSSASAAPTFTASTDGTGPLAPRRWTFPGVAPRCRRQSRLPRATASWSGTSWCGSQAVTAASRSRVRRGAAYRRIQRRLGRHREHYEPDLPRATHRHRHRVRRAGGERVGRGAVGADGPVRPPLGRRQPGRQRSHRSRLQRSPPAAGAVVGLRRHRCPNLPSALPWATTTGRRGISRRDQPRLCTKHDFRRRHRQRVRPLHQPGLDLFGATTPAPTQLTSLPGTERDPAYSPDGTTVAFTHSTNNDFYGPVDVDASVWTVPATGGTPVG